MAPISIPKYCFGEEIKKLHRVDYDAALRETDERNLCNVELYAELHDFEASLTDMERIAFRMRQSGYTNREIIPCIGISDEPQMSRLMKKVLNKALAYLQQDVGKPLLRDLDAMILRYSGMITCVCLMGEGQNMRQLEQVLHIIRSHGLKTSLYSGHGSADPFKR